MNPLFRLELKILLRWISSITTGGRPTLFAIFLLMGGMSEMLRGSVLDFFRAIFLMIALFIPFIPVFLQEATDPLAYTVPISAKDRIKSRLFLMGGAALMIFIISSSVNPRCWQDTIQSIHVIYSLNWALSGLFVSLLCGICLSIRMHLLSIFLIPGALILVICLTLLFFSTPYWLTGILLPTVVLLVFVYQKIYRNAEILPSVEVLPSGAWIERKTDINGRSHKETRGFIGKSPTATLIWCAYFGRFSSSIALTALIAFLVVLPMFTMFIIDIKNWLFYTILWLSTIFQVGFINFVNYSFFLSTPWSRKKAFAILVTPLFLFLFFATGLRIVIGMELGRRCFLEFLLVLSALLIMGFAFIPGSWQAKYKRWVPIAFIYIIFLPIFWIMFTAPDSQWLKDLYLLDNNSPWLIPTTVLLMFLLIGRRHYLAFRALTLDAYPFLSSQSTALQAKWFRPKG